VFQLAVSCPLLSGYNEPETISYQITLFGPIGADVRQLMSGDATSISREKLKEVISTKTKMRFDMLVPYSAKKTATY